MQCVELVSGVLVLRGDVPIEQCGTPLIAVADPGDVVAASITAAQVTEAFGFGFGSVFFFWSLGYGVGLAKRLINKA